MQTVFFSYSHADEALRDQLETQLAALKRQDVIATWHDRRISAGEKIDKSIDERLQTADIILLLVSPDFIASNYCYELEMARGIHRHEKGEAVVIPVILRPCDWHGTPFGNLMATPKDGKPVTQWPDRDEAFLEVARAIRAVAERRNAAQNTPPDAMAVAAPVAALGEPAAVSLPSPRSSNLRLTKHFSERDKDAFRQETFEFIARFFEASLNELAARNAGVEGAFRRIDANRFSAVIYQNGQAVGRCSVFMGGMHMFNGIAYSSSDTGETSFNESLSVDADDQMMFLRSMGMASYIRGDRHEKLSQEGAAELYWGMLIRPLQGS